MNVQRKCAKTKRTVNGNYLGRPIKGWGAVQPPIAPELPRWKRTIKRLRDPGRIISPITGEIVELFGPPKPVYEMREIKRGRPPVKDSVALLRIIKATQSVGKRGAARIAASQAPHREVLSVKREYTRARRDMRRRAKDNS